MSMQMAKHLHRHQMNRTCSGTIAVHPRSRSMATKPKDPELKPKPEPDMPPAGPHERPELTDPEKTPGAGTLPEPDDPNAAPTG
jgi:hypothetical protein